jgi:predicted amidohydrolase YtcJ
MTVHRNGGSAVTRPDLIIRNADVRTMDPGTPRAEAIAITGDRITAVGSDQEIAALAGTATEQLDARGGTVLPGIVDAHNHVRLGATVPAVSLTGATSLAEIRDRIRAHLAAHPDADWIEGDGWNYTAVPGGSPTAAMIDDVCAGRPAWLFSYDVHTVWLNSEALRRFGVAGAGSEVAFGTLETDDRGLPTGWVHDFAVKGIHPRGQRQLAGIVPGYHPDAQYRRLVRNLRDAARFGITTIVEPQNGLDDLALYERATAEGELRSRLVAAVIHTPDDLLSELDGIADTARHYSGDRFRLGPVKLYIDDVVEPHTAAMLSPYHNAPSCSGHTFWPAEDFARVVVRLEELGLQAFVHGTGDRGIRTALDAFQTARELHGPRDTRHQIVHVECLDPQDVPRFAELGVTACMQPRHCAPDLVQDWRDNVGPDRERQGWAMRSLHESGATLAFSSDWNVAEMDPMIGIYTALTRADLQGNGAWNLDERLDLDATLHAYTAGSARANFADQDRGTLAPGRLADVIVLGDTLHSLQPQQIPQVTVTHTLVGGEVVHRAG